jgi:hypothetical protein
MVYGIGTYRVPLSPNSSVYENFNYGVGSSDGAARLAVDMGAAGPQATVQGDPHR